jgi:DNA-binding ferritin-like protein|tara:strand:- start:80 stop:454 length:375 start_codon:yes stop_codon:yes gene_type:complete
MTFNSKFSEVLNIDPPNLEVLEPSVNNEVEDDYDYARKNLRDLIDSGMGDLNTVMDIARQSESPRAFEVATNLMKTLTDTNKDLLELAKKKKELTQEKNTQNVTNALFVGSTADLQKLIQGNRT